MKKKFLLTFILLYICAFSMLTVFAATTVNVSNVSELQSTHPYSNSMDTTWVYTHPSNAETLEITFSSDTATESNYDWIYILDGSGTQIGKYSGTELASKTITVTGNAVKIRLTSDSSVTKNGFTVTSVTTASNSSEETYQAATYKNGYYEIANASQLYWFAEEINSGRTTINGRLVANIIVNDSSNVYGSTYESDIESYKKWKSISSEYNGTFDGNGYTISGLYFYCANYTSANEYGSYGSLFKTLGKNGKICNLNIDNSYFYHYNCAATLCAFNRGKIENCNIEASVQSVNSNGIVYQNNKGTIQNCSFTGMIRGNGSSRTYLSGICCYNHGDIINCVNSSDSMDGGGICDDNEGNIINCVNYGEVWSNNTSCGGICKNNHGKIFGCTNEGEIRNAQNSQYSNVGGICGTNDGIIECCANKADISFHNSSYGCAGGICGTNDGDSLGLNIVKDCYNIGNVEASSVKACGGIVGYNTAQIMGCYHKTGNIYVTSQSNTGTICGINATNTVKINDGVATYTQKGIIRNCIDFWYGSRFIGNSTTGAVSNNIIGKQGLYGTPAAYFLNSYKSVGDINWRQNIDNDQTSDEYPVLDSSHGTVYRSQAGKYSNTEFTDSVLPDDVIALNSSYDLEWVLYKNGLLSINTNDYPMSDYLPYATPWYPYREQILSVEISGRTTKIGEYTFLNCTNLKSIKLKSKIYTIGAKAFLNCEKLQSIYMSACDTGHAIKDYAFYGCKSLETIAIGKNATIESYAFGGCTALKNIYILHGGSYISLTTSGYAFSGVNATLYYPVGCNTPTISGEHYGTITSESISNGICGDTVYWKYDADAEQLTIYGKGELWTYYSGSITPWYQKYKNITSIEIEDGIIEIPAYSFEYLGNIQQVTLPNSVKLLALNAFNDCSSLNNIMIPSSVENFTGGYFNRCESLTDIYYVGTKEEFEAIPYHGNVGYYGAKVHYLVWNKSSSTCTSSGYEGYYSFDDTSVYDYKYDANKNRITALAASPATGHSIVWTDEIAPTCHEIGKKERWECEKCGVCYTDQSGTSTREYYIIPINPDNHHGDTEIRDASLSYTGDTYCLGCNQVIERGENIYKIKFSVQDNAIVGDTNLKTIVTVGTDKDASVLYAYIQYPSTLTLKSVTAKDFEYVEKEDEYTEGEYTTSIIVAQYSDTELIPKNKILTPFELTFDISESAVPGKIAIEITDESCLVGNETHNFEERIPGNLEIKPKLAESIEIIGNTEITTVTTYTVNILPDYTTDKSVEWSVDTPEVATVDENGTVTPVTSGTFILTAKTKDGSELSATKNITITRGVESIEIVGAESVNTVTTYTVNVSPDYATNKEIEWSIDKPEIATINQNGILTPLTSGIVTVTAKAKDGSEVSTSKTITVIKLAEKVEITGESSISSPAQYTAIVTPNYTSNKSVVWSVDKENIAKVDEKGIVTPVTSGTVILTAEAADGSGASDTKNIEIIKYAESIEIVGESEITKETQYSVIILPDYATDKNARWSVSDESVATVDENGVVTPLKNGKVVLTAASTDASGISTTKSIVVTVSVRANSITSDIGIWDKKFDSDITDYTIYVPENATAIYLTSNFENASAKINDSPFANNVRKKVTLNAERNNVEVVLTPMTGNTLTSNAYTINIVKFEGTKTTISEVGKTFTVKPINIEMGNTVILALYNGDTFVEMQQKPYTGENIPFTADKAYTNAKVMVWKNLENMSPICDVEIVK